MSATAATQYQTGHVGLNVSDLDRAKRFYTAVFGFDVLNESSEADKRFVFLGQESRLILTLWQQSQGAFSADRPGLHHLAFQVASIEDVQAAERRLRDHGARLLYDGIVPHGEGLSSGGVFFEDPDGIRIEIYAPAGADEHNAAPSGSAPTCGFF